MVQHSMKYAEQDYIKYDPFTYDESERSCVTVKILKCRAQHDCAGTYKDHKILPGEIARFEKARIDNDFWGSYYMCIPCLEKEMEGKF